MPDVNAFTKVQGGRRVASVVYRIADGAAAKPIPCHPVDGAEMVKTGEYAYEPVAEPQPEPEAPAAIAEPEQTPEVEDEAAPDTETEEPEAQADKSKARGRRGAKRS